MIIKGLFSSIQRMLWIYSLESPQRGDFNEYMYLLHYVFYREIWRIIPKLSNTQLRPKTKYLCFR